MIKILIEILKRVPGVSSFLSLSLKDDRGIPNWFANAKEVNSTLVGFFIGSYIIIRQMVYFHFPNLIMYESLFEEILTIFVSVYLILFVREPRNDNSSNSKQDDQ